MLFGAENNKGLVFENAKLKVVVVGKNRVTEEDILVHDAKEQDPTLHQMLVRLDYPVATGIIRSFNDATLEDKEDVNIFSPVLLVLCLKA